MLYVKTPKRNDKAGSGEFGSPRGDHSHAGIDYAVMPNSEILSPVSGRVTKFGICYRGDPRYLYVQVTDTQKMNHRFFYVQPSEELALDCEVREGDALGVVQDVAAKYPGQGMVNHVHYEIRTSSGEAINPDEYWRGR